MDADYFAMIAIPISLLLLMWGTAIVVKWLETIEEQDRQEIKQRRKK